MKITKIPAPYSPAYRDALFRISATADEIVELDIFDHAGTGIIGRKRLYGSTVYDVNVAGYAQGQFEVAPLRTVQCTFVAPPKRIVNLTVGSGSTRSTTRLNAGIRTIYSYEKLSASPETRTTGPEESDEIAVIAEGGTLKAVAVVAGTPATPVTLATKNDADGLHVFGLKMADMRAKLRTAGLREPTEGEIVTVRILDGEDEEMVCQRYRVAPTGEQNVRICWWNGYGQIDYHTMRCVLSNGYDIRKERVYTADGYRTTGCSRENRLSLASDFVNRETMEWLSGIAVAPGVWMEQNYAFVPLDVLTETVTTVSETLSQLQLTVRKSAREIYQHQ